MPDVQLLDWTGTPVKVERRPPERIAATGLVKDEWTSPQVRSIDPSVIAATLKAGAQLDRINALGDRLLDDDHLFAVTRTLKLGVAGLSWQLLPFDDSAEAEAVRKEVESMIYGLEDFSRANVHLLDGEIRPLSGHEIIWDRKTWTPIGLDAIAPSRWVLDRFGKKLLIKTNRAPRGEELQPNGFLLHRSTLEPARGFHGGLWRKLAWLYLFKHFSVADWVRFAEIYGRPFRMAFYENPDEAEKIAEAIRELGVNAAAVFPQGTEIQLKEAQRYGSTNLYNELRRMCEDGMSKVVLGHVLTADAKPGTGTLAGNAASQIAHHILGATAVGLADTWRRGLIRPFVVAQRGAAYASKLPELRFDVSPPEDLKVKAETYDIVQRVLAPTGQMIDPEHVADAFGIPDLTPQLGSAAEPAKRRMVAKDGTPIIRDFEDVNAVASGVGHRALEDMSRAVLSIAEKSGSIDEFIDSLWERYDSIDASKLGLLLRDATVAAHEIGRGGAE